MSAPTRAQLVERVEHWRTRLTPEWRITLVPQPPRDSLDPDENPNRYDALIHTDVDYLHAALWVRPEYLAKAKPDDLDLTIAHELLHLHYIRCRNVLERLMPTLGDAVGDQARETFLAEEERAVDRLSRLIVGVETTGTRGADQSR